MYEFYFISSRERHNWKCFCSLFKIHIYFLQYFQLAQDKPKSQFLFQKNCSACDLCIMTLPTIRAAWCMAERRPIGRTLWLSLLILFLFLGIDTTWRGYLDVRSWIQRWLVKHHRCHLQWSVSYSNLCSCWCFWHEMRNFQSIRRFGSLARRCTRYRSFKARVTSVVLLKGSELIIYIL